MALEKIFKSNQCIYMYYLSYEQDVILRGNLVIPDTG